MSKKDLLIEKVKSFETQYFNDDQKRIAIEIIKNTPEEQAQEYADFIFYKRKTGFAFDYSPEIAQGRLITLKEDKERRINVSDSVEPNEHKLIIGDNYNALKALLLTHKEKIDIIYIDPPYNTESAKNDGNQSSKEGVASKFIYKDKFGRGGWLNMMKVRLTLAKELLSENGVIFVSIDDSEQAYLKVLMDDIFEERNFLSCIPRKTRAGGGYSGKNIGTNHDYLIIYKNNLSPKDRIERHFMESLKQNDGINKYRKIQTFGAEEKRENRPTMFFEILLNDKKFLPKLSDGGDGRWGFSQETVLKMLNDNLIIEKNNILYYKEQTSDYSISETFNKSLDNEFSNGKGTDVYKDLKLDTFIAADEMRPKPTGLIKWIAKMTNNNSALILDFFAGSGTTGHAVMELNKEDGGNRKFILVTNNENNIATNVTYERLKRIITGKTSDNKENFEWLKTNKPFLNEKLRVINIDDSVSIEVDEDINETIYNACLSGIKLLDENYNKNNINLYYDLAALNPLLNDENKI